MADTYEQRKSGLVVPKEKQQPPARKLPPLEIQDAAKRLLAREALLGLWDAMDLSRPPRMQVPGSESYVAHYQAYRYIGEMLLGKDCPEKEIWT